jgi:SPX domain protein involved in polyphosphate accumulation
MRRWTEGDEAAFVKRLEKELLKCERFQVGKVSTVWDAMRCDGVEMEMG